MMTKTKTGDEKGVTVSRRGRKPRPIVEKPTALWNDWIDPPEFREALVHQLARHDESYHQLHRSIVRIGEKFDSATLKFWVSGRCAPRSVASFDVLARIERRYDLPAGYFRAKLPHPARASVGNKPQGVTGSELRRLSWHLPDDFNQRPAAEREQILEWVRRVVISGATDYRRYQAKAMRHRYAIRFPDLLPSRQMARRQLDDLEDYADEDPDFHVGAAVAPPLLAAEMHELIGFKTATLTQIGLQRSGVWNDETSAQKIEHLGLMFGALSAEPSGPVQGFGLPRGELSFALLMLPEVWDWYVQWRERRRGFYTRWEVEMLRLGKAFVREGTGWLRQHPAFSERVVEIEGLVTAKRAAAVRNDWNSACDALHEHLSARAKEIERVARIHRDPFEPILPILEADSPVGEYRKITDEVLRLRPDARRYPRAAAESARSFLLLRLGLHLGLRQKNLRQLLYCGKGGRGHSDRQLEHMKRGELRWSERHLGWEVMVPSVAFKNSGSSFFGGNPFRLLLPDLGGLYAHLEDYMEQHRAVLLNGRPDPGTFFVKTMKATSRDAAYDQNTFYEAWRLVIQRYGIFNPYTGRGAIKGILPHGPHNIRDVLATHILKQTGSYDQASYAIQDTPDMVAKHYGRFLPQDKSALAAQILNQVWEAA